MKKINVTINLTVKADPDDDDSVKEAVYARLEEDLIAEEIDFSVDEQVDGEEEESEL